MTDYVVAPPPQPAIPVGGGAAVFPVRRVYCIGRNYADHAIEMGAEPGGDLPYFQKNPDNLDPSGRFPYPARSAEVHHEIELAAALGSGGTDIAPDEALAHVFGYAVALDMTCRDLQARMKASGQPWEIAKAFERSAPIAPLVRAATNGHPAAGAITLDVNGDRRQSADLSQMIWKLPQIIAYLSAHVTLAAGDVILTGTPAGVGPVARGDRLSGAIEGVGTLETVVV